MHDSRIPAVLLAFGKSYLTGKTNSGKSFTALVHVHSAVMTVWILMLIAQAWFVRARRYKWHHWVGRSSYVIAPAIIVFTLIVVREGIIRTGDGLNAENVRTRVFGLGMTLAFAITWGLAIANRKRTPQHVRYIVSTVFAMGSAIVFRIINNWFEWVPGLDSPAGVAAADWAVLTLPLLVLIGMDWRRGIRASPYWVVAALIALMHIGYFTFTKADWWMGFIRRLANLPP